MHFAAIGDSFTEGVGDEGPDGSTRGWADLVAAGLARHRGEPIAYANLAVRGRLLAPIVTEQLDAALALDPRPTLLTLNGGGNDMLRRHIEAADLVALTERAVRRATAAGVDVVLIAGADPSARLPLGGVVRRRGEALTAGIAALAAAHGTTFVDVFHDAEIRRPGYWSADRLHLGAPGHRRVAGLILAALGAGPVPDADAADHPRRGPRGELRYYREHVLPWVGRRLRGHSSGDGRTGKHVAWVTVPPPARSPVR